MDSLTPIETIIGIAALTVTIQVTLGTITYKVLSSRYATIKEVYEVQLRFVTDRGDRAERELSECRDDLDQCRERAREQGGGFIR